MSEWLLLRRVAPALVTSALLLAGCESYRPSPLDLDSHRQAWLARTPDTEETRAFAARLAGLEAAPAEFDASDGLSLPEGEVVALFFNGELRLARLRAEVARASAAHAGLWEDPVFGFDAADIISESAPLEYGATLSLTIPLSGRLGAAQDLASSNHRAELLRVAAGEWNTRAELRRVWLEWSAQGQRIALAQELLARLEGTLPIVDRLGQTGELSRAETRLFHVEQAQRQNELRLLEARQSLLALELRQLMGLPPASPLPLVPSSVAWSGRAALMAPQEQDAALAADSMLLAAARADYESAERTLALEVRKQYPDVQIGGGYGEEDDSRILFGVAIPIPLWNRNRQGVAEAQAQREVARASFQTTYEKLAAALTAARVEWESARAQRQALESVIAPLVDEQEVELRRIAELGEVDLLLVLESLTRQYDTKIDLVAARLAESLGAVAMDALVGPPPHANADATPAGELP